MNIAVVVLALCINNSLSGVQVHVTWNHQGSGWFNNRCEQYHKSYYLLVVDIVSNASTDVNKKLFGQYI